MNKLRDMPEKKKLMSIATKSVTKVPQLTKTEKIVEERTASLREALAHWSGRELPEYAVELVRCHDHERILMEYRFLDSCMVSWEELQELQKTVEPRGFRLAKVSTSLNPLYRDVLCFQFADTRYELSYVTIKRRELESGG
jgi:uncharacterized SAM-binding protein YcdF (DUF218 family)